VIDIELQDLTLHFFILSKNLALENMNYYLTWFALFFMQGGATPAYIASGNGHTETVALLLANKANINAASNVQQFKLFKYL
jgi:ankyrin repeat protein